MVLQDEVDANFVTLGSFVAAGNIKGAIFVKVSWGVLGLNRDEVGLWDPSKMGEIIWDEDFTVLPAEN